MKKNKTPIQQHQILHVAWRIKFVLSISDKMRNRCITSRASRGAKHQYLAATAIPVMFFRVITG